MKLFRGRQGFPRWSFTDGRGKPRRVADGEIDEADEATMPLPRFALTRDAERGARSSLTPADTVVLGMRSYAETARPLPPEPEVVTEAPETAKPEVVESAEPDVLEPVAGRTEPRVVENPVEQAADATPARAILTDEDLEDEPVDVAADVPDPAESERDDVEPEEPAEGTEESEPEIAVADEQATDEAGNEAADDETDSETGTELEAAADSDADVTPDETPLETWRRWFVAQDWPVAASDDAVRDAGLDHPDRETPSRPYAGLPAERPAVVRAKNGRGFGGGLTTSRRRRRRAKPRPPLDLDVAALDDVLAETRATLGDGFVDLSVYEGKTGLLVAADGGSVARTALWHRTTRELASVLRAGDLPRLGAYCLVTLSDHRAAVVVTVSPDLGACLTVDTREVTLGHVVATVVPSLRDAVASTAREV